jgi:7-keto-8-aminopelargonate synthetase-like enzyme
MVASLGKAIGITGGVIASDQLFINQLLATAHLFQVLE